ELISSGVGFRGEFVGDTSQPNGQPRRQLDVSRAESLFGFRARRPFHDGVRQTIDWFLKHRAELAATGLRTAGRGGGAPSVRGSRSLHRLRGPPRRYCVGSRLLLLRPERAAAARAK